MSSTSDESPRRLDAYIRVSSVSGREGERFISPKEQEERIRAWATANGHDIIAAHHELDVSGGSMDRPLLNEVMRRFDAGETEGVVVLKLDRFGRTLVGSLQLIEHIHERGGLFASVSDGFDITTETGRLVLRILLSLAQYELERIRAQWRSSRARALKRGWHLGEAPFGYTRVVEVAEKTGKRRPTGPLIPDPVTGPIVTEMFKRRAAGAAWSEIRDWLNENEIRTNAGSTWAGNTVAAVLRRKTYLGIASGGHGGDAAVKNAHQALIDEVTWQAAQERRGMRADTKHAPTISRGIVRCAGCRYSMKVTRSTNQGYEAAQYYCQRHFDAKDCPNPASAVAATNGHVGLDDIVIERMFERLERIEFMAADTGIDQLKHEIDMLDQKLDEDGQDAELEAAMGRSAWLKRLSAIRSQADAKRDELKETIQQMGVTRGGQSSAELRQEWENMSTEDKRAQLARVIRYVFLRPPRNNTKKPSRSDDDDSRRDYFADRVHIVWTTDPEVEVPRQGLRGYVIRPFAFPDTDPDHAGVTAP